MVQTEQEAKETVIKEIVMKLNKMDFRSVNGIQDIVENYDAFVKNIRLIDRLVHQG